MIKGCYIFFQKKKIASKSEKIFHHFYIFSIENFFMFKNPQKKGSYFLYKFRK